MGWQGTTRPGPKDDTDEGFPSGAAGGSLFSEGHRTISPQKCRFLEGPTRLAMRVRQSKLARYPLGNKPDSPESGISVGAVPVGLRVGQLKMDMPPVFTASQATECERLADKDGTSTSD